MSMDTFPSSKTTKEFETYDALQSSKLSRVYQSAFESTFNRQYGRSKLSIWLLIASLFCLAMTLYSYIAKNAVSCTINIGEYSDPVNTIVIDESKCPKEIIQEKIYVYYKIDKYPLHAHAGYKLHCKDQFKGEIGDTSICFPYDVVKVSGEKKHLLPCGAHPVNVYNDKFTFYSDPDFHDKKAIRLDQTFETLSRYQEYEDIKEPLDEFFSSRGEDNHFWLRMTLGKDVKFHSGVETLNRQETRSKMSHLLSFVSSGEGMRNGHFVQWMTPPPFENFVKLYGIINTPVEFPFYIKFENVFKITSFGGNKQLLLVGSNGSSLSTSFLASTYLALTVITLVLGVLLLTRRSFKRGI